MYLSGQSVVIAGVEHNEPSPYVVHSAHCGTFFLLLGTANYGTTFDCELFPVDGWRALPSNISKTINN